MRVYRDLEQGSDEWLRMRLGKITGTRFKSVLAKKEDPVLIYEIIAELINPVLPDDLFINSQMQRGIDFEPFARRDLQEYIGHNIEQVGFVQHQKKDYCGYSPDGLIKINGEYKKSVEMKCPDTKTHARYIIENIIPTAYESQVLAAFYNADTIDQVVFASYDDRCTQKPLFVKVVNREDYADQLKELDEKLPIFWDKVQDYYTKIIF
jgi:hypothetical protein